MGGPTKATTRRWDASSSRDADGVVAAEGTHTPTTTRSSHGSRHSPRRPRAGSRSRGSRRRPARAGRASRAGRRARREHVRAHARRALATGLVQRHRLRRAGAAVATEPSSTSSTTSCFRRCDGGRPRAMPRSSACARHRCRSPPCPAAPTSATSSTASLEATDFASADLDAELAARLAEQRRRRDVDIGDTDTAIAGSPARSRRRSGLCWTRCGSATSRPPTASTSSASSCRSSAATADGHARLSDLAPLLETHLPAGDPLAGYADRLRDPLVRWDLRGYLTGTLDLVLRASAADGSGPSPSSTTRATGSAPTES